MNKFNLPNSLETIRKPFIIPGMYKRLGILSDLHIPYHSNNAIAIAFEQFLIDKVDSILLNGDIIDFYQLSSFMKDPRKRSVKYELDSVREFLLSLKKTFSKAKIFFKKGNHETRYEKYLTLKAPELLGNTEFELEFLLKLHELNIDIIDDKTYIKAGGLSIFHGHELKMKSITVNPARTLYLKAKLSALCSHLHAVSQHSGRRIDGHIIGCWSTGHLAEESPDYAPYNEWSHGFAEVLIEGKEFEVHNYKIINNRAFRT